MALASTLITQIRRRTDAENQSTRHSDTLLLDVLNESLSDLWSLRNKYAGDTLLTTTTTASDGTTYSFSLPATAFTLRHVELETSSGDIYPVFPSAIAERTLYKNTWYIGREVQYAYVRVGSSIEVFPTPESGLTLRVWYVPKFTKLATTASEITLDSDEETLVIYRSCLILPLRDEQNMQEYIYLKDSAEARVIDSLKRRYSGIPRKAINFKALRSVRYR